MLPPYLETGIEEAHDLSCVRIGGGDPIPLVIVAHRASEPEILPYRGPTQLNLAKQDALEKERAAARPRSAREKEDAQPLLRRGEWLAAASHSG